MPFGANDEVLFGAEDEVLDEPAATGTSGGPVGPRRRNTPAQRQAQDARQARNTAVDVGRGQGKVLAGVADMVFNSVVNAPADLLNAGANLLGAAVDPYASAVTRLMGRGPTNFEEQARAGAVPRVPLFTEAGREAAEGIAEVIPEPVKRFMGKHPLAGDAATVGGGILGARAAGLVPKGPQLNDFSRNVARVRDPGSAVQRAPVADVAQRYTVVPEDAAQSARVQPNNVPGSTRASLGRTVTDTEVPFRNIGDATRRVVEDMPQRNLVDANGRVDEGLLEGAIRREAVPYEQIKTLPAPTTNTLAGRLRQAWETRGGSLKGDAVAESRLAPLMDVEAAPLSTDELLLRWREINDYASQLRKAAGEGAPAAQIKGRDLRAIAEAILDEIDDRATAFGTPELVDNLKAARVNIARLHTLGDSLDNAGWVDPTKLVAMAERSEPLTGALAQLAADAKAAPRSLAPLKRAVDASGGNELDQFGRQPNSWLRNVAGHLGGNLLARRGVESLNRELRAGSGLLRQPVPEAPVPPLWAPNSGPPAPPPAPLLLPAPEPAGPMIGGGGFAPAPPAAFDVMGLTPDVRAAGARHPAAATERAALGEATVAPAERQPRFRRELLGGETPRQVDAELGAQIGQLFNRPSGGRVDSALIDFDLGNIDPNPMPDLPRGVAGPRSAQLSDPAVPRGFELLLDDTPPPLGPRFGPGDEFPDGGAPPAAPVAPAGPSGPVPAPELAIAPDAGPASPRFDVTEALPGQSAGQFADQFLMPGARRIEDAGGLIDYVPGELDWRITNQFTPPGMEGQGFATNRVLDLARRAQAEGMPLHSDVDITDAIARLMLGARERGMLNFDEANALRMQQLLGEGQTRLRGSVPWFQNIRPAELPPQSAADIGKLAAQMQPGEELVREGGRYVLRKKAAPVAPTRGVSGGGGGIARLLNDFDEADISSVDDLVRGIEEMPDVPPAARAALDDYLEAKRLDYAEDAGRGADNYEERFVEALRRLAGR